MYFVMAWRNVWRNPRRTAVIGLAVVIAVWSMIFLTALMYGMVEGMVRNSIITMTGDIQIHQKGYNNDPVIEHSINDPGPIEAKVQKLLPPGGHWAPRVRVNAIISNARHSGGVTLVGIDPAKEANVSFIGNAVKQGNYLKGNDEYGIMIGRALLKKFGAKVGHKVVLMSQDTTKNIASRAFRITGVFTAEMESTEKQYVYVTLPAVQKMLKLGSGISEVAIMLTQREQGDPLAAELRGDLPKSLEIMTWKQLQPITVAYLAMFNGFIWLWYLVVFIAMGFGIVNTLLMAVMERIREFGLLKALGLRPRRIIAEVVTESLMLMILGMLVGNILGLTCTWAVADTGIDLSALAAGAEFLGMERMLYPVLRLNDVLTANITVLLLGVLVSLYPAVKAARFTPVEALSHT